MICKLYRDFTNHTVVNTDKDLHRYNTIQPKFRIRKCGIAETAVIQSIESMD